MRTWISLLLGLTAGYFIGSFTNTSSSKIPEQDVRLSVTPRPSPSAPGEQAGESQSDNAPFSTPDESDDVFLVAIAELVLQIDKLKLHDFPAAFDRSRDDDEVKTLLYQRWCKLSPRSALNYLLNQTDYQSTDYIDKGHPDFGLIIGKALIESEGRSATPLILDLLERTLENSIGYDLGDTPRFRELFKTWAKTDFDAAMEYWNSF